MRCIWCGGTKVGWALIGGWLAGRCPRCVSIGDAQSAFGLSVQQADSVREQIGKRKGWRQVPADKIGGQR